LEKYIVLLLRVTIIKL